MPRGKVASKVPPQPLSQRTVRVAMAFRSMMIRYPGDLARAVGFRHKPGAPSATLRDAWAALPSDPGLRAACWLGHCSVLLRFGALTICTDPVLSPVIGPRVGGVTFGPRRLTPGAAAVDLPALDLILVSHAHYDHLDRATLKAVVSKRTELITAQSTRGLIPRGFKHIHELHWLHSHTFDGITITAVRPKHWGARNGWDRHRGYNSYIIESEGSRVLFAADTAQTTAFDHLGPFDLGIFGIGAYQPWIHAHANPEQVWSMATKAGCRLVLPVHYSTFKLSDEPEGEPLARLTAAAGDEKGRIVAPAPSTIVVF